MKAKEIAEKLLKNPELEVRCSVDISTGQEDFGRRVFGEEAVEVVIEEHEIMICFTGELND